jgi:hypothetical protein
MHSVQNMNCSSGSRQEVTISQESFDKIISSASINTTWIFIEICTIIFFVILLKKQKAKYNK